MVFAGFMQGLYCFFPELLLEGDDHHVFSLFNKICTCLRQADQCHHANQKLLQRSWLLTLSTFVRVTLMVVVVPRTCDIVGYLLGDYSFVSRRNLCRVFKLCCLPVQKPLIKDATCLSLAAVLDPECIDD